MSRRRIARWMANGALATTALVALAGCASPAPSTTGPTSAAAASAAPSPAATEQVAPGDIPDTQAFVTTTAPSGAWSIKVPEGWSQQTLPAGLLFTDKLNTIQAVERAASSAPSVASVRSTEVPALLKAHAGLRVTAVAPFTRAGGSGVMVAYQADSAKDPVTGKVHRDASEEYLFFKQGREVVVTLSGAVGADNVDPWKIVTGSFTWRR